MAGTGFDEVPSVVDLGIAVRRLREQTGLRQRDLALAAGVGERFLVELEAGKPTVRLDKVLAVLEALGVRLGLAPAVMAKAEDLRNTGDTATGTTAVADGSPAASEV